MSKILKFQDFSRMFYIMTIFKDFSRPGKHFLIFQTSRTVTRFWTKLFLVPIQTLSLSERYLHFELIFQYISDICLTMTGLVLVIVCVNCIFHMCRTPTPPAQKENLFTKFNTLNLLSSLCTGMLWKWETLCWLMCSPLLATWLRRESIMEWWDFYTCIKIQCLKKQQQLNTEWKELDFATMLVK